MPPPSENSTASANEQPVKLSIITICYNEPRVKETCESITRQVWQNFEWIVIDGGSHAETQQTFEPYKARMAVFVSERDKGIYNAMNKGLAHAQGEYVLFLNAGDYFLDAYTLQRLFAQQDWKDDIVFCDALFIRKTGEPFLKSFKNKVPIKPTFFLKDCFAHASTIIRRELFIRHGGYNENRRIVSDWEKWIEFIVCHQATCSYCNIVVSVHNYDGISSEATPEYKQERADVIEQYYPGYKPAPARKPAPVSPAAPSTSRILLFGFIPLLSIHKRPSPNGRIRWRVNLFWFLPLLRITTRS